MAGTACAIYGAWPSAASNFAWAALGLHSVVGAYRRRRLKPRVDGIPGPAPVTCGHTPGTGVRDPAVAGGSLGRAVRA
ncbi:hypothetical protein [Arthrobacter sp. GCM10027362]|uniref:hypothetical protein n=1 Tax=Arthrobacter sp. GCM10027362 TaxID=3273379 RepID=UPI0036727CA6